MSEKPIIFTTDPIKAILAGRKTQTRRPLRRQPPQGFKFCGITDDLGYPASHDYIWAQFGFKHCNDPLCYKCTYGRPGDRLWVREPWRVSSGSNYFTSDYKKLWVEYRAGWRRGFKQQITISRVDSDIAMKALGQHKPGPWRPSIYMPRWTSRITLEITDVRIERVQNISAVDTANEGMFNDGKCWQNGDGVAYNTGEQAFQALWDSIYASRGFSWNVNPWVWVICFKIAEQKNRLFYFKCK